MNVFTKIIGINILIYLFYIILFLSTHGPGIGAVIIVIHSIILIALGISVRAGPPRLLPDEYDEEVMRRYENQVQKRQAFIISGLLILIVGMPACFVLGASGIGNI